MTEALQRQEPLTISSCGLEIIGAPERWMLCPSAETKLNRAITENSLVLVNEFLLVKMNGKMSAVCLEDRETPSGKAFLQGYWYSPVDPHTREQIVQKYENGIMRLTSQRGSWCQLRRIDDVAEWSASYSYARALRAAKNLGLRYDGPLTLEDRILNYRMTKESLPEVESS